ncbi:hypothetical protein O7635_35880 [Asanoa sp. WMMD1127]|uniref:hypothetical protein n=1 Tax=Asanoa sp. WMMD1127 TaxID=3016107 RepID=UPI002415A16B|nr:hypothetical protein [Asanoa sp. WMMD1127]MDG4827257.1 hypothetical protein [Asanoa sp. WMMD1127]
MYLEELPLLIPVLGVSVFGLPVIAWLVLQGRYAMAFLAVTSILYGVLLGRSLLWRRLGKPAIPRAGTARRPLQRR